jgi:uncharacterized protein
MSVLGPGPHTRVRRLPKKAHYDEETIFAILDAAMMCHVAAVVGDTPMALPTLHARDGRTLYLHGSPSNAILKAVAKSGHGFVTVTLFDGLRLARSAFESSIAYRSVVVMGAAREVDDPNEKARVLDIVVEKVLTGRSSEVRPSTEAELRLTFVVAIEIDEASAKLSSGPTDDEEEDRALPIWSGTIPTRVVYGEPIPDTNGAMATGEVAVPASVQALLDEQ